MPCKAAHGNYITLNCINQEKPFTSQHEKQQATCVYVLFISLTVSTFCSNTTLSLRFGLNELVAPILFEFVSSAGLHSMLCAVLVNVFQHEQMTLLRTMFFNTN